VTHVVFAYRFRAPVPRWADEGGAVLSEDVAERMQSERMLEKILETSGRPIPLRRLFSLRGYPRDVLALYAEGHSVARFLVDARDRKTFLTFVHAGMEGDWDNACERHYGYKNVEEMEKAWQEWLRAEKRGRERDPSKARIQILEAEVGVLKLENQLLKNQLNQKQERTEWKREQIRLEKEIKRARENLERLRQEMRTPPNPAAPERKEMPPKMVFPVPADIDSPPTVPPKRD
jgi:hypothetical protein